MILLKEIVKMATLWHKLINNPAVISWSSLWRIVGRPSHGQLKAWELFATHTTWRQQRWSLFISQAKESRKAPLCRQKPWSSIGRAVSQLEEPFSEHDGSIQSWWQWRNQSFTGVKNRLTMSTRYCTSCFNLRRQNLSKISVRLSQNEVD